MKYVVDHIVDDIIVLENLKTKEIIEVNKCNIGFTVKDGNILVKENNTYHLDKEEEAKRRAALEDRLNKLKGGS